ncbi:MAG: hypothetical protein L0216_15285 [Planctomycetales bacterium]|nr:hypothetical protein [Planctomycetales bacterium]
MPGPTDDLARRVQETVRDFIEKPEFAASVRGVIETAVLEAVGGSRLSEDDVRRIASASGGGPSKDAIAPLVADAMGKYLTMESLKPIIEPIVQMALMRALKKEREAILEQVKGLVGK